MKWLLSLATTAHLTLEFVYSVFLRSLIIHVEKKEWRVLSNCIPQYAMALKRRYVTYQIFHTQWLQRAVTSVRLWQFVFRQLKQNAYNSWLIGVMVCRCAALWISLSVCKGVRCPPIFSLSNLIAGTNRKAYLLHASFALKDSHYQWSSITDFTVVQQLMPEHLHTYELS